MQTHHSQEEPGRFSPGQPRVSLERQAELEDYLDHLTAELVGVVPYRRRRELREEVRSHLLALADAFEELGSSPEEAMDQALEQFGDPRVIARQWVCEWRPRIAEKLSLRAGILSTLPWIVVPSILAWFRVAAYTWRSDLVSPEFILLWPVLAGSLAGYLGRGSRTAGACVSAALCTLVTAFFMGLAEPYQARDQLAALAAIQFFIWIPLSTLSAAIASWIRRRQEQPARARR